MVHSGINVTKIVIESQHSIIIPVSNFRLFQGGSNTTKAEVSLNCNILFLNDIFIIISICQSLFAHPGAALGNGTVSDNQAVNLSVSSPPLDTNAWIA